MSGGARAAAVGAVAAVLLARLTAHADDEDEVIEDPELAGEPLVAVAPTPAPVADDPAVGAGSARVLAEERLGVDTDWDRATGEDVVVQRLRLDAEVGQPLGRSARVFAAARLEHVAFARPAELPDDVGGRFEARLLDAWLDVRVGGLDLRVGNQIISWGRVDVLSPGNVWNPLDLRDPFGDAQSLPVVPVPAVRLDAEPLRGVEVSLAWQPVFVPLRADLLGTDAALLGPGAPAGLRALAAPLTPLYGDDAVVPLDDPSLPASPRENLAASQLGARLTARFGEAEVGGTVFWGLSKLPTLRLAPELRAAIEAGPDDTVAWLGVVSAMSEGRSLVRVRYERNLQLVVDAEAPAGDVLLSAELGWAPRRALVRFDAAACRASCVVHPAVVHGAAQVERVAESWQLLAEGFVVAAVRGPDGAAVPADLALFDGSRAVLGAVAAVRWAPPDSDWEALADAALLSAGPAVTLTARVSRAVGPRVRLEVGGIWTEASGADPLTALDGGDMAFTAVRVAD